MKSDPVDVWGAMRRVFTFYGQFTVLTVLVLITPPHGYLRGTRVALLVLAFLVSMTLIGQRYRVVWDVLAFTGPLSALMVLPDTILVRWLEVLVFEDDEIPLLFGAVPAYMLGMWTIPLSGIVWLGIWMENTFPKHHVAVFCAMGAASAIIFGWAEAFSWMFGGWRCVDAVTWGEVTGIEALEYGAIYIIVPEALLGIGVWRYYTQTAAFAAMPIKFLVAIFLATVYSGLAVLSYSILDRIFLAGML